MPGRYSDTHVADSRKGAMAATTMNQMWAFLQTYTMTPEGEERAVNHLNEWGGFSRRLNMPVFTGWRDHTEYDKVKKTTTALVSSTTWKSPVGVNNQERWLSYAESHNDAVAAFFIIHAVDEKASRRTVRYIDDDRVFVGKIVRDGPDTYIVGQPKIL